MYVSPKSVRLYVGFGGSGAKSIVAFVKLLAAHEEWGDDSETRFAFVLVDTDKRDLSRYADQIREACRLIGKDPIVRTVQTSRGVPNFQHYAADRLQSAGHDERLQEHWWYGPHDESAPKRAFTAEKLIASPEDGAGQCPPVSTFLAWNNLAKMGEEIESVIEELRRRLTLAVGEQESPILCSFIAGLAGGTGRGCWHMLAFKVREVLANAGKHTLPVGYFFDSSVFQDVMNSNPGLPMKMRVNSLTGISELHAWMCNETDRPDQYNFALPNIDSPRDPSSDLVDVRRLVTDAQGNTLTGVPGQSPVSQAFVLFGGGKAGEPGAPEHYYSVLANAMYARMIDEIASRDINDATAFGGVCGASIVIPINDIKQYVRVYVSRFLPAYYAAPGDTQRIAHWAEWITHDLEAPQNFGYTANSDGNLYERVIADAMASQRQRLIRLEKSMEKATKDYKATADEGKRIDAWVDSKDGKAAIEDISRRLLTTAFFGTQASKDTVGTGGLLRDLGILSQLSRNEFSEIYGGDKDVPEVNCVTDALRRVVLADRLTRKNPNGTTESIDILGFGAKALMANLIAAHLKKLADQVPGAAPNPAGGSRSTSDEVEKARKGFLASGIDANEAGVIMNAAKSRIRMKCMGAAKPVMGRMLHEAADKLQRLATDLKSIVNLMQQQAKDVEEASAATRDRLFWNRQDYDVICSQSAVQLYDGGILAEQRLQPVESDDALSHALVEEMESGANDRFQNAQLNLMRAIRQWLDGDLPGANPNDRRLQVKRLLSKGLESLGGELVLKRKFYVDQFGFYQTIKQLMVDWGREFRRRAGSELDTAKLMSAFRVLFGRDYPFDGDGPVVNEGRDLDEFTTDVCKCMAVELANRCDVLFHVRMRAGQVLAGDQASVVLPAQDRFEDDFASTCSRYALDAKRFEERGHFKAVKTHSRSVRGNPFAMVAYAQRSFPDGTEPGGEGLNRISSLDYHKDPDIAKWLQACEDVDGRSLFANRSSGLHDVQHSYGLGFSSPIFVRNKSLRNVRWRPWALHGEAVANERSTFVLDVIAYALLDEPRSGTMGPALQKVIEQEHWQMPLISLRASSDGTEDQAKKWQFTRAPIRHYMDVRTADHPAAKAGDGYTSIKKLMDALLSGTPNPLIEAIAEEAEIFVKEVLQAHPEEVSAEGALSSMFRELNTDLQVAKEAETGPTADEYRALYDQLIRRVEVLQGMNAAKLLGHFDRRGRV